MILNIAKICALTLVAGLSFAPTSHADAEPADACELVREDTVAWTALGERVTFRTELSGNGEYAPDGTYTLIRADGTEVALGAGSKFIDDFDRDNPPTCQDHLDAAHVGPMVMPNEYGATPIPVGMTIRYYITGDTVAEIMSDASCLATDQTRTALYANRPDRSDKEAYRQFWQAYRATEHAQVLCGDKRQIQQQYEATPDVLLHLIAIDAPLLTLTRSTYYSDQVAFDPETNTLHDLFFWGC